MGSPQLRPMCTRAQRANPRPSAKRARPSASRQSAEWALWPRNAPRRIRRIAATTTTARIRSSRDHGTRPRFDEKAATTQYSQNAAQPAAKTSSTARIPTHRSTAPGTAADVRYRGSSVARISYDETTAAAFKAVREIPHDGLSEWREAVRRHLCPRPGMTLVDVGAGTGQFAAAFSDWFDVSV